MGRWPPARWHKHPHDGELPLSVVAIHLDEHLQVEEAESLLLLFGRGKHLVLVVGCLRLGRKGRAEGDRRERGCWTAAKLSDPSGRYGPCSSIDPTGTRTMSDFETAAENSANVMSSIVRARAGDGGMGAADASGAAASPSPASVLSAVRRRISLIAPVRRSTRTLSASGGALCCLSRVKLRPRRAVRQYLQSARRRDEGPQWVGSGLWVAATERTS